MASALVRKQKVTFLDVCSAIVPPTVVVWVC